MPDDNDDTLTRVPLEKLNVEDTRTRIVKSHDALVMNELQNLLLRQQEQDGVISDLRALLVDLSAGMLASLESITALQTAVATLERHQKEMHARQDKIAELCNHLAESIASVTEP